MAKVIDAILNLKDNMSKGLLHVSSNIKKMDKDTRNAVGSFNYMTKKWERAVDKMVAKAKKLAKISFAALGGLGVYAFKKGLTESINLEGYRTMIMTATKDYERTAEVMKYSISLANKTPFEGGEMASAAGKLESRKLKTEEWLAPIGNMSAALNKPLDQTVEAILDARMGQMKRLEDYSVRKEDIGAFADEFFGKKNSVLGNKNEILDYEKWSIAVLEFVKHKYKGGMDDMAKTTKGLWSTITGVTKSGLATILGMQMDGTVKVGSILDRIKSKAAELAEKMIKLQESGKFEEWGDKVSDFFRKTLALAKRVIDFFKKNKETIKALGFTMAVVFSVIKIVEFIAKLFKLYKNFKKIFGLLKLGKVSIAMLNPHLWIVLAIVGAIAGGVYLIAKNWDKVKEGFKNFTETFDEKYPALSEMLDLCKELVKKIGKAIKWAFEEVALPSLKIFSTAIEGTLTLINLALEGLIKLGEMSSKPLKWVIDRGKEFWEGWNYDSEDQIGHNANGTAYWRGGITRINERGGEIIDLPRGTRIIPHDKSMKMAGNNNINVNVNIGGNIIGDEDYADFLGNKICQKILTKLKNM